jgi:biopolymer transport protein ExbD
MGPKQRKQVDTTGTVNLTPLIDVTFQLIIFFMLVAELTNLSLADVCLPRASEAEEGGAGAVVFNIVPSGDAASVKIGQREFRGQGHALVEQLKQHLLLEAEKLDRWTPAGDGSRMSELEVLIRSDRGLPSEYVLWILEACSDLGIYRINVGAKQGEDALKAE